MNVFTGDAEVSGCRWAFAIGTPKLAVTRRSDFPPLLRGVVFVGETALGSGFDFQCAPLDRN